MSAPQPGYQTGYLPAGTAEDRQYAMLAHLSTLVAMVLSAGWLSFVGPLALWLVFKNRSPFVRQSAAGAFNFNLSMWALSVIGWICVLSIVLFLPGLVAIAVSFVCQILFHIVGAVRAHRGELYRYPLSFIRILS